MASRYRVSKFVRRMDGLPVVQLEPAPETPEEQARRIRQRAWTQETRLWTTMFHVTGMVALLMAIVLNPHAFYPERSPVPGNEPRYNTAFSAIPELLEMNHQQMLDWQQQMQQRRAQQQADIEQVQAEALRVLEQARTTIEGRPAGTDGQKLRVKLGDGRVLDNLEDAAAWLKRMASKLGNARLSLDDIEVLLETDGMDWALSVSLPDEAAPLRLALASRLWIVLLFTPEDMRYVEPQNDDETTGHGRIGLLFIVPRVPYEERGERY